MSTSLKPEPDAPPEIEYPECDGEPMSDNTIQFRWIALLATNAQTAFGAEPNVFVAADLLIYPVEGDPRVRAAPDLMVALGRPRGDRGSYRLWEEGGIFPQVVVEVVSPGNRADEMDAKLAFYERHGAEEYLAVRPQPWRGQPVGVSAWRRRGARLVAVPAEEAADYLSPNLGFRFKVVGNDLVAYGPDGQPLRTHGEVTEQRDEAVAERYQLSKERAHLTTQLKEAAAERDRLAAKLRALGLDPDAP